jgi:competence protein ComFB
MTLHDVVEGEVFTELERIAEADPDFCGCDKCKADVAAFTLCQLPSMYSDDGLVEVSFGADDSNPVLHATVIVTLAEAVEAVKAHIRH